MIASATVEHCEFPGGYRPDANPGDCTFDARLARRAIEFFPRFLIHIEGPLSGKPFHLRPWQADIIGTLFGWLRPDGTRRYRTAYIEVPRKNGKSTLAMGIALLMLFIDGEPGAKIFGAASTRDQAKIVFNLATQNVLRSPILSSRATPFQNHIDFRAPAGHIDGTYRAVSAEAGTLYGGNASGLLFDELHIWKGRQLYDVLKTSTGARPNPLLVEITTAGFDRHSICWEEHDYATKVRDGLIDDMSFLPILYCAEEDDDWTDPKTWAKANPNLGVSVFYDYIEAQCQRAKDSPAYENTFRQLHLNQWTEQAVRWIQMAKWDACGAEPMPDLRGKPCFGGLDLSTKRDLTALTLAFPMDGGRFALLPICWVPEERAAERERVDRVPYLMWHRQGHLETTPGDTIDYDFIRKRVNELHEIYNIQSIACDPWNANQLMKQLRDDGFTTVDWRQGFKTMTEPCKEFDRLICEGKLIHAMHPVLRWCASNVALARDTADNWKPDKATSTERIDPFVASIMAVGLAAAGPTESVYEERGLLIF